MKKCKVHPRVTRRHPELSEEDVVSAWDNALEVALRTSDEADFWVAVGADLRGRLVEMVAVADDDGTMVVFQAMTPPSRKTLRELRLVRR